MISKSDHCDKYRCAARKPGKTVSDPLHPQDLHRQIKNPCSQPGYLSYIENLRHFSHNDQIQNIIRRSHTETGICQGEDQQTPAFIPQSQKKSCNGAESQYDYLKTIVNQFKIHLLFPLCSCAHFCAADGKAARLRIHQEEKQAGP